MTAPTLTEFLLARIAEDEAVARLAPGTEGDWNEFAHRQLHTAICGLHMGEYSDECECDARARVLAECEAKRRILRALDLTPCPCQRAQRCVIHDSSAGPAEFARERYADPLTDTDLRALAAVYADHPDYRAEWAPNS